jgi:hypothetical protein
MDTSLVGRRRKKMAVAPSKIFETPRPVDSFGSLLHMGCVVHHADGSHLILSGSDGNGHTLFQDVRTRYAARHGITNVHCSGDPGVQVVDGKMRKPEYMKAVMDVFPLVSWFLWVDDDTLINPDFADTPLSFFTGQAAGSNASWIFSSEHDTNTGVWFVRNDAVGRELLRDWSATTHLIGWTADDQHAMRSVVVDHIAKTNGRSADHPYRACGFRMPWSPDFCDELFSRLINEIVSERKLPYLNAQLDLLTVKDALPFFFLPEGATPQLAPHHHRIEHEEHPNAFLLHFAGKTAYNKDRVPLEQQWMLTVDLPYA